MEAKPTDYLPLPSKRGGPVVEYKDKLDRRRFRNARRSCNEMRKLVPKRKDAWDLSTVEGLIKQHAYRTDTTRAEFAVALNTSVAYVHKIMAHPTAKNKTKINKHHITILSDLMVLTEEQRNRLLQTYNGSLAQR